jgi:glycosyltransferase involved in cell wall biosynthesis
MSLCDSATGTGLHQAAVTGHFTSEQQRDRAFQVRRVIPSDRVPVDKPTILAIATEWDSSHGGVSTFNRELCAALARCDATVVCGVPKLLPDEVARAKDVNVRLVAPAPIPGEDPFASLARPFQGLDGPVNVVIGHGRITGPAALAQVRDRWRDAAYVHFVHMDPKAIEWHKLYKDRDPAITAEDRIEIERELGRAAQLVVAVGPELRRHFANYLSVYGKKVHEFIPGLFPSEWTPAPPPFPCCLMFGRMEDAELKGLFIAAKAMAALRSSPTHRGTRLTVRGATEGDSVELRTKLDIEAGASLAPDVETYTSDRATILRGVRSTALVLMPSLQEGFGLTALEAISEGTPVLISRTSGLARALEEHLPAHAPDHIIDVSDSPPDLRESSAQAMAERMRTLLDDNATAFARVAALREAMRPIFDWDLSARQLLEQLETANSSPTPTTPALAPATPVQRPAEAMRALLKTASKGLHSWRQTLHATNEWIERPELQQLLNHALGDSDRPLVLLGPPGSGKSALLSRAADQLIEQGRAVLAIKADQLTNAVTSAADLARVLDLPTDVPAALFAAAALGRPVLIIDQLDALADLVDLRSARLNVLLDLVRTVADRGQVAIILSCRSFELDHDARLRSLDCVRLELSPLPDPEIERILAAHAPGVTPTPRLLELLHTVQNLNTYLQLPAARRSLASVDAHQALLQARWDQLLRLDTDPQRTLERAAEQIAGLMADREELWLSTDLLDRNGFGAPKDTLVLIGLLVEDPDTGRIAFAHQTMFEFARARSFLASNTLVPYVLARQDALFVRATLWTALPYLRGVDPPQYLSQFASLWNDPSARLHIQGLLIDFLGQLSDPTEPEVAMMVARHEDAQWRRSVLRATLGQSRWFRAFERLLPGLLSGDDPAQLVVFLFRASAFAPDDVADLIERHWLPDPARHPLMVRVLSNCVQWTLKLTGLVRALFQRDTLTADEVTELLRSASTLAPADAPEFVAMELRRRLEAATAADSTDPDSPQVPDAEILGILARTGQHRDYVVGRIAETSPRAFVAQLFPCFARALARSVRNIDTDPDTYRRDLLPEKDADDPHETFASILLGAVLEEAKKDVDFVEALVREWQDSPAMSVHRYLVQAIEASLPTSARLAASYLLEDPRRLRIDGIVSINATIRSDSSKYTTQLLAAAAPYFTAKERQGLEQAIAKSETWRTAGLEGSWLQLAYDTNRRHRLKLRLALGIEQAPPSERRQVESELRLLGTPPMATPIAAELVRSPMSAEQMRAAKDEDLLNLFRELPDSLASEAPVLWNWPGIEASRAFGEAAKQDPERFLRMLPRFSPGVTESPVCDALRELAALLPLERIEDSVRELLAKGFFMRLEQRGEVASALRRTSGRSSTPIREDLCERLEDWLGETPAGEITDTTKAGQIDRDDDRGNPGQSLLFDGGDGGLLPHDNFPLLDALTSAYLGAGQPRVDDWMRVLETHLERAESAAVWRAMALHLEHVLRSPPERAERFFSRLFERVPSVLTTHAGLRVIARAMHHLPLPSIQCWMEGLAAGSWSGREQAFGELLVLFATRRDATPWARERLEHAVADFEAAPSPDSRSMLGIARAVAEIWNEPDRRPAATDLLARIIPHATGAVAKAVMRIFTVRALAWDAATRRVLEALRASPQTMVDGGPWHLVEELRDVLPTGAELVADVVTALMGHYRADAAVAIWEADVLIEIAMTLQRLGDPMNSDDPLRAKGLALFEQLLGSDVYEAQQALDTLDRKRPAPVPRSRTPPRRKRRA